MSIRTKLGNKLFKLAAWISPDKPKKKASAKGSKKK